MNNPLRRLDWSIIKNTSKAISIIACMGLMLSWCTIRVVLSIRYDTHVTERLERAHSAHDLDTLYRELHRATDYLQLTDRDEGYTSIIYDTPSEDVGYWYRNLVQAQREVHDMLYFIDEGKERPPNNEINVLIQKVRRTIAPYGDIKTPQGISVYPHNLYYFAWAILSIVLWGFYIRSLYKLTKGSN